LVEVHRHQNWMIYRLPARRSPELERNLQCLQDCVQTDPLFKRDLKRLRAIQCEVEWVQDAAACCGSEKPAARKATR
jgi:ArsR family transcriptional regulator